MSKKKKCYRCKKKGEGEEVRFIAWADYVKEGKTFKKLFIHQHFPVWVCNKCLEQVEVNRGIKTI